MPNQKEIDAQLDSTIGRVGSNDGEERAVGEPTAPDGNSKPRGFGQLMKTFINWIGVAAAVVSAAVAVVSQIGASEQAAVAQAHADASKVSADAALRQAEIAQQSLESVREQLNIAREQLDSYRKELQSRRANSAFRAYALESGNLRVVAYNVGADFVVNDIDLVPTVLHSGSASARPGNPVAADFQFLGSTESEAIYIIEDYIQQICRWQSFPGTCDQSAVADLDVIIQYDGFEQQIPIDGRIEVN